MYKDRVRSEKGQATGALIHSNLNECGIYICSPEVLTSFQENFMFHNIKDDFLKEMLHSEIKEEKIHIYTIQNQENAMRVLNPNFYYQAT